MCELGFENFRLILAELHSGLPGDASSPARLLQQRGNDAKRRLR